MQYRYRPVALLLALCLLLSGCRSSPVLEELVYTQQAETVDPEQEMLDPEDEGEEDEQFSNETVEDAETPRDTTADTGVQGEDTEVENAVDVSAGNTNLDGYDDATSTDADAETENDAGTETNSDTGTAAGETGSDETDGTGGTGGGSSSDDEAGNGSGNSEEDSGQNNEDVTPNEDDPDIQEPEQEITYRQIIDATGSEVSIPEDVALVTAVDGAAQLVEMLGGTGRLVGADASFVSSSLAQYAFSDVAGGQVQSWWSGNGSGNIDDSCFASLLSSGVQVCFVFSGKSLFTDGQLSQLSEAGIAVVTLYAMSSAANLENNASIVAQVLGGDAESIAGSYISWVESAISEVSSATSGTNLTSLYISAWDSDAYYQLNNTSGVIDSTGYGLAVAYAPGKAALMTTFMAAANVTNESCDTTYLQNKMKSTSYVYVTPMFHQFSPSVSGTQATYYSSSVYAAAYDLFTCRQVGSSVYYQLGSSMFPAVIVASESVRQALENSWFWQYHDTDASGYVVVDGTKFYCGIYSSYEIYVNPSGMCDWTEGSVEAPLEAYWVACKLQGTYSLEQVKAKTNAFYQEFFGVTLSDGQLTEIFGE